MFIATFITETNQNSKLKHHEQLYCDQNLTAKTPHFKPVHKVQRNNEIAESKNMSIIAYGFSYQ